MPKQKPKSAELQAAELAFKNDYEQPGDKWVNFVGPPVKGKFGKQIATVRMANIPRVGEVVRVIESLPFKWYTVVGIVYDVMPRTPPTESKKGVLSRWLPGSYFVTVELRPFDL